MLIPFIGTRALRAGYSGAMTFSVAAHTALIAIAVAPSGSAPPHAHGVIERRTATEHVRLVEFTPRLPMRELTKKGSTTTARRPAKATTVPRLTIRMLDIAAVTVPEFDLDLAVAEIDLTSKVTDSLDFVGRSLADVIGDAFRVREARSTNGVYDAESVSKMVNPFANNPRPEYPRWLESSGVEGDLAVHFVVSATGRVEPKSIVFDSTAHPMFVESVRRCLQRSRYVPAELDGRRVPQLVSQRFSFRIVR